MPTLLLIAGLTASLATNVILLFRVLDRRPAAATETTPPAPATVLVRDLTALRDELARDTERVLTGR
ncbi:hypothetical protein [Micromonospora sp. NPDC005652]|uniref:hypothetical protein n=1 Tax=Micromonospora sp. NPDC005652 TaxID=3157046 RepID=UPI0033EB39D7